MSVLEELIQFGRSHQNQALSDEQSYLRKQKNQSSDGDALLETLHTGGTAISFPEDIGKDMENIPFSLPLYSLQECFILKPKAKTQKITPERS